jgi:hypothetical protein
METSLVIEPIGMLDNPRDLIGACVQARYFDDVQFRAELYIGEVKDVKKSGGVVWVLFQPIPGQRFDLSEKWRPMSTVKGTVYYSAAAVKAIAA